jgi:hypothetical protein
MYSTLPFFCLYIFYCSHLLLVNLLCCALFNKPFSVTYSSYYVEMSLLAVAHKFTARLLSENDRNVKCMRNNQGNFLLVAG